MHSISISDIATLTRSGISWFVSSLPSWIIDLVCWPTWLLNLQSFTFHTSSIASSVVFVDGSYKNITDSGTVNLTSSLALSGINYVPFNLVSVSHLTKTLNCFLTFFPYSFQDLQMKKVIGGYERVGLYYLQCGNQPRHLCSCMW